MSMKTAKKRVRDDQAERVDKQPSDVTVEYKAVRADLHLPLGEWKDGGPLSNYHGQRMQAPEIHLDLRLSVLQSKAMRAIFVGLYETNARLANGIAISGAVDVVRYMLEQVADTLPSEQPE